MGAKIEVGVVTKVAYEAPAARDGAAIGSIQLQDGCDDGGSFDWPATSGFAARTIAHPGSLG